MREALYEILEKYKEIATRGGGVFILDAKEQILKLVIQKGPDTEEPPCGNQVKMGKCLCGLTAQTGRMGLYPSGLDESDHERPIGQATPHGDICIPLYAKEFGILGVLHLRTDTGVSPSRKTLDILGKDCEKLADALFRAQAVDTLVTQYKKLQEREEDQSQRVHRLRLALEHAKRAKSDFLSSVSHELRTPLNAIIGFSQVLQEEYFGGLNTKQKQYVNDILESGKHLLDLINDILDLSRVESGEMKLEVEPLLISFILESSLHLIKEKAFKHSIEIEVDVSEEIRKLAIMADHTKLKQVLFNLLSNAAKFTPDNGAICVGARIIADPVIRDDSRARDESPGWIEVFVRDTGIGIEGEDKKRVFDDFYQVSAGLSGKTPGTGLGLPLAKRLVELHGGRIWVESEGRHQGSCFVFTLPIGICPWEKSSELTQFAAG
ncbi:MAG: HAMP domain-containing histidine kinase [Desulfatibacillum sp.]|nr:HAMP domain-containing histidine kinase [Desulfatibacillum sp.]